MPRVWRIDRLPTALDDVPIVEVGYGSPCVEVTGTGRYLPPPDGPLEIVWKRFLAKAGDFCWPMMVCSPAMTATTAEDLENHLSGFSFMEVQYIKGFGLRTPPPYERLRGKKPELKLLFVTHCVDADDEKSTIVREAMEGEPDNIGVFVRGIEERNSYQEPAFSGNWKVRTKRRKPDQGLFIQSQDIEGFDFFRVNQNRISSYCTDKARDFILDRSYTGIDFLEVGEII